MPRPRGKKKKLDKRTGYRVYKTTRAVSPGPSTGSESEKNLEELSSQIKAVQSKNVPSSRELCEEDIEAAMAEIHDDGVDSDANLVNLAHKVQMNTAVASTSRGTGHAHGTWHRPRYGLETDEGKIFK